MKKKKINKQKVRKKNVQEKLASLQTFHCTTGFTAVDKLESVTHPEKINATECLCSSSQVLEKKKIPALAIKRKTRE